jgi:hypothetical protein
MRSTQAWLYLAIILAIFWVCFAILLIVSDFPFLVISISLTALFMISIVVVALAWAYQNNI